MAIPFDLYTFMIAAATVAAADVLLDVSAALTLGARFSRAADRSELVLLTPFSLIGAVLGVTLLVALPRQATLATIGVFLLAYSAYAMTQGEAVRMVSRAWAPLAGLVGGTMGTLFGVGALTLLIGLSLLVRALAGG